ncbi:GNAT family N-acetyltransferase [Nonomuraea basaltis]|uniref:GNAT family N-acetyltransferase n=1 Tax=Nonomuraea basaltis TaxID=2495887 RepID=UPI001485C51D|nr:GNAT family N-acetyltransferase [Nonomuraea basaltis]
MTRIETARLQLRPYTLAEAGHVVSGLRESRTWSPGYPRDDDRDIARLFLQAPPVEALFGPLQIVLLSSDAVIGGIGFFDPPDSEGTVGLGYGLAPEVEGRGYATEALRALLHEGFATGRITRAVADTAHDNPASQRVLEKAGLRRISSDERLHYYATERWDPPCAH